MPHHSLKHGELVGDSETVEYAAYRSAKTRCMNPCDPGYPHYGGRGIKFTFTSFQQFLESVGRKPSSSHVLDRINNDGDYAPGNVRWATHSESMKNRRRTPALKRQLVDAQRMRTIKAGLARYQRALHES